MTLTQLNAFVLVARLGSVTAAANPLGVSEPAVSQALSALRLHLGDPLVSRGPNGMTLTTGGSRLPATPSQIVGLGAEAHAPGRAAGAEGAGVAPGVERLVTQQLRGGELSLVEVPAPPVNACWHATLLERQYRSTAASALRRFLTTPEAMHLMRAPAAGVSPSRFRPPAYVTIWS